MITSISEVRTVDRMEVTIDKIGWRGEGLVRLSDGWIVVPGALPGEVVEIKVHPSHPRSHRIDATVERVVVPSPDRAPSPCALFPRCRGCHFQHVAPEFEQRFKRESVAEIMTKFAGRAVASDDVDVIGKLPENGQRSRCRLTIEDNIVGLHSPSGLLSMRDCIALTPPCRDVIAHIEDSGPANGHVQILDAKAMRIASEDVAAELSALLGTPVDPSGQARQTEVRAGDLDMAASLDVWTHGSQTASAPLYAWLDKWFSARGGKRLLELGCGIGSVAAHAAKNGLGVVGIDGSAPSIAFARENCPTGEFRTVSFERGCRDLAMEGQTFDIAVINPMREPVGERVFASVEHLGAREVVYLAPSPASAAKDLAAALSREGTPWNLSFVGMVDLHPRTYHVMMVCVISRN